MWVCPKCGRSFKNVDQSHYCGKPPATIEEYIAAQPEEAQDYLRQINAAIKASIPEAKEKISWSMPTYWKAPLQQAAPAGADWGDCEVVRG